MVVSKKCKENEKFPKSTVTDVSSYLFDHHLLVERSPGLPGNGAGQTVAGASRDDSNRNLRGNPPVLSVKESVVDLVKEAVTRHDDDGSPSPDVLLGHQLPTY